MELCNLCNKHVNNIQALRKHMNSRHKSGVDLSLIPMSTIKETYLNEKNIFKTADSLNVHHKYLRNFIALQGIDIRQWTNEMVHMDYEKGLRVNPMQGRTSENDPIVKAKSEKISQILKEKYRSGELVSPLAGKTKENNETLRKISKALIGHPYNGTDETLAFFKKSSIKTRGNRLGKHFAPRENRKCLGCDETFYVLKSSKRKYHSRKCASGVPRQGNGYSNCRGGVRKDLGHYVRSGWEANICRLLKYLDKSYAYEPSTFHFGEINYTPDLLVGEAYYEIKGHAKSRCKWDCNCIFCQKSKPKFELAKQHLKLKLIGVREYKLLEKRYSKKISNWEY